MKDRLLGIFDKFYGGIKDSESAKNDGDIKVYFAPGRVNLIGEHTDYNGGHVFPCALTIGTYAAVRLREDDRIRMYSDNFPDEGIGEIKAGSFKKLENPDWCNYPIGVMWTLKKHGYDVNRGMDIAFYGDIPDGAGLSSSASIEVLTAYMMNDLFGFGIELKDIAVLCQYSENKFNDSNCGIATSGYNDRRRESESALADLERDIDISSLGDLSIEEFEKYKYCIKDPVNKKRAKHAVYENQRTIQAVKALKENDIRKFGELMVESHISLRDDYEVSCREADIIVEEALKLDGVWGIRMTGGGFGGCLVGIVDSDKVENIKSSIGKIYKEKTGVDATFYDVSIGGGPALL